MIPRLCPGGTVLCVASGPSLTPEDVDFCRGKVDASIVINNTFVLAPWATALYACDASWWNHPDNAKALDFAGLKYALLRDRKKYPSGVTPIPYTGESGLEVDPSAIRHGKNSGYQAINLAVHFGAARILLLGYDMSVGPTGDTHWHPPHANRTVSPYADWLPHYETLVEPLKAHGVSVINCSRRSALTMFQRCSLSQAIERAA